MLQKKKSKEEILEELKEYEKLNLYTYKNYRGEICGVKLDKPSLLKDKELLKDKDFLLKATKINGNILLLVPRPLKFDKELLLIAAENSKNLYLEINLPKRLSSDYDFMLKLVSVQGNFLRQFFIHRNLSPFTDKEKKIILAAVKNDYEAFDDVNLCWNLDYYKDKSFALELVEVNWRVLRYFGKELRSDKDIILKAVGYNYQAFQFATRNLRNNKNFLLHAMEVNACCLAYAPSQMREDRELVTNLMQKTPFVYRYAKGEMQKDTSLALTAVKGAPNLYNYLDFEMVHKNKNFVLGLVEFINSKDTPLEVKQFLKGRLKFNSIYQEWKKEHPDLDGDLSEILLCDDVAETFVSEYNLDLGFRSVIDKYIPEVSACFHQKQRGDWHIYNVMGHILHSIEEINALSKELNERERKLLAFTMLFHDLGKPEYHKEKRKNGKIYDSFKEHNIGSEKIARRVLKYLDFTPCEKKLILTLVKQHDIFLKFSFSPKEDWQVKPDKEYLENLILEFNKIGNGKQIMDYLILVAIADNKAQNPEMTKEPLEMIAMIKKIVDTL